MAEGRYTEAAQLYLEAGDDDMYQRCLLLYTEQLYLRGINRLQMGDYSEAIELFAAIAEYKNSSELIRSCRYLWALELEAAGDYAGARELCLSLEDYPGRDVLIEKCNEGMLRQACSHALEGDYDKAAEVLRDRGD
ncbi:MAG: tetratricopeptide repeat protein, partial [Oscillospiraceae bacterium]|nr:tetratricopeptide repeat protein [Oscillospiraceae bacterium]